MTQIQSLNSYATVALAAYATGLDAKDDNVPAYRRANLMSDAQASQFDEGWSVFEQSAPDSVFGFSAVLLQNRHTGEKYWQSPVLIY